MENVWNSVDCEQSLSFPCVQQVSFLSVWRARSTAAKPRVVRSAGAEKKLKKKETAVVFWSFRFAAFDTCLIEGSAQFAKLYCRVIEMGWTLTGPYGLQRLMTFLFSLSWSFDFSWLHTCFWRALYAVLLGGILSRVNIWLCCGSFFTGNRSAWFLLVSVTLQSLTYAWGVLCFGSFLLQDMLW